MHIAFMMEGRFPPPPGPRSTRADRLQWARLTAGYKTPSDAAKVIQERNARIKYPTYMGHENGSRGLSRQAEFYSAFFKVDLKWLLTGKGLPRGKPLATVVGYVGAGAEILPLDNHTHGHALELIEAPQWSDGAVEAAIIRGDSMHPLKPGYVIFWRSDSQFSPEECFGKLCVVDLEDGRRLVKEVRRGSRKGAFTLFSWNAGPIEDVLIVRCAPIIAIKTD